VGADRILAYWRVVHPIPKFLAHNNSADTSWFTAMRPNAATNHMTQDAHLKIVRKTGSSRNKKQHVVGCEYIHIKANAG